MKKVFIKILRGLFLICLGMVSTLVLQYYLTPNTTIVSVKKDFELYNSKGIKIAEIKKGAELTFKNSYNTVNTLALHLNEAETDGAYFKYERTNKKNLMIPYWKRPKMEE